MFLATKRSQSKSEIPPLCIAAISPAISIRLYTLGERMELLVGSGEATRSDEAGSLRQEVARMRAAGGGVKPSVQQRRCIHTSFGDFPLRRSLALSPHGRAGERRASFHNVSHTHGCIGLHFPPEHQTGRRPVYLCCVQEAIVRVELLLLTGG